MHCPGKISIVLLLSVFLFSFASTVSAPTTACEISLLGAGDSKFVTVSEYGGDDYFAFVLSGWDAQGTKAYISINGVAYTWEEGKTYTIGNTNFYVPSVDVNYTGSQEAVGAVRIIPGDACTVSSCLVSLSGAMDLKTVTLSDGSIYNIKLNGWDTQGTKAYVSVNDVAYTWNEAGTYSVNSKKFYVKSVDVQYTDTQEAVGYAKIMVNQECRQQAQTSTTCTDSDGGNDYNAKGTVYGLLPDGTSVTRTDECSGNSPGYSLLEYACQSPAEFDGAITSETYNCPNGCVDGACVPANQTCTDSDNGATYVVKGHTIGTDEFGNAGTHYDACSQTGSGATFVNEGPYVVENYCENGISKRHYWLCPSGYTCKDGACLPVEQCTDSMKQTVYFGGIGASKTVSSHDGKTFVISLNGWDTAGTKAYLGVNGVAYTWTEGETYTVSGVQFTVVSVDVAYTGAQEAAGKAAIRGCFKETGSGLCGDGVCEAGETQQSCPSDCARQCPSSIDISFNKESYSPGDYFEVLVKVFDAAKNLMPNQAFNVHSMKEGTSTAYYTDSTGIYKSASVIPSDPKYNGEWTFVASVSEENCPYVSDEDTIQLVVSEKCGDGYCEEREMDVVCSTTCTACGTGGTSDSSAAEPACQRSCTTVCHAACPKDCTPSCGNGVCDATGSLPENEKNCPQDCRQANYCGAMSSDPACTCESGYVKESFQSTCQSTEPQRPAATASSSGGGGSVTGGITASAECTDSDGGFLVSTKGTVHGFLPNGASVQRTDECSGNNPGYSLLEYTCQSPAEFDGAITSETYNCPNGCRDGACITDAAIVKEQVKCVFSNSNVMQECYSDKGFSCKGIQTCVADVSGANGEKLAWKSGCGLAYTVIDGQNEYANFDCGQKTCTYYRCVPAYRNLYLYTDKTTYGIGDVVNIQTSQFEGIELPSLKVMIKDPYGKTESILLEKSCLAQTCPACEAGAYCPPCKSTAYCAFRGSYAGTGSVGVYGVSSPEGSEISVYPTTFRVFDSSLIRKYLILSDIGGFRYVDSAIQSGPENVMLYMAYYEKYAKKYAALVVDFEDREKLEAFIAQTFQGNPASEESMEGYYVYTIKSGGQKIYLWTYKTFLAAVVSMDYQYAGTAIQVAPVPESIKERAAAMPTQAAGASEAKGESGPGFFTGMITGAPTTRTAPANCGTDSLNSQCACSGGETKESFTPPCEGGVCGTHYRCKQAEPGELVKAYLDKYPSDMKAAGTECEQKGGYCISSQDSCSADFTPITSACKTASEKCCVKQVDRSDFLEIVMKLEGIRVKMDSLERQSDALSEYYKTVADDERAEKFADVADMFGTAKGMIDDIIAKIRANLDDPEAIRDDVKDDVAGLKSYIDTILERMVSA